MQIKSVQFNSERPWRRISGLDFTAVVTRSIRAAVSLAADRAVCDFTMVLGAHRQKAMTNY
jgi:hypothetical protein